MSVCFLLRAVKEFTKGVYPKGVQIDGPSPTVSTNQPIPGRLCPAVEGANQRQGGGPLLLVHAPGADRGCRCASLSNPGQRWGYRPRRQLSPGLLLQPGPRRVGGRPRRSARVSRRDGLPPHLRFDPAPVGHLAHERANRFSPGRGAAGDGARQALDVDRGQRPVETPGAHGGPGPLRAHEVLPHLRDGRQAGAAQAAVARE